jgi:hypothetical protein
VNAEHERHQLLLERAEGWRKHGQISEGVLRSIEQRFAQPWRTYGVILQIVFFLLACVALIAGYAFLEVIDFPAREIVLAAGAIALAESLIRRAKWFGTGVEAALWLGAMISLVTALPRSGTPEALLVVGAAVAIAAWRMRQPLFGIASVCFVVAYAEVKFDLGVVVALAAGSIAMASLTRTRKRPSTEWLWAGLVIVMPIAGRFAADARWRTATIVMFTAYGIAALALALERRSHAFFAGAGVALGIAAVDFAERLGGPLEWKLAVGGGLLLSCSWVVARSLRANEIGLVMTPSALTELDTAIEIAGTITAAPSTRSAPTDSRPQGDGGFGGAGATGSF